MPATTSSTTTSHFLYAVAEAENMDYNCDGISSAYDGWPGVFTPAGRDHTYQTQAIIGVKR